MSKTQDFVTAMCTLSDTFDLSVDEKLKAMHAIRSHVIKGNSTPLRDFRQARAEQGIIGSGKKSQQLRDEEAKLPTKTKGKKNRSE